ncbi:MAG: hypothetical protein JWP89_5370 [Schlesneria sp.]|nr:hypothetical protein [Schlesneria sp.]
MNPSDPNPSHNSQPVATSTVGTQSDIEARLRALKADPGEVRTDFKLSPRGRIALITIASAVVLLVTVFFIRTAVRLHAPNATILSDGWTRVVDRQWGFEAEFPTWYTKSSDGPRAIRYDSRFPNSTNIRVRVADWKYKKAKTASAADELVAILNTERQLRPVEVLIDRSTDSTSPMIDFISTCGPPGSQWKVRERILIKNEVMIRIDIVRPDFGPPEDLDRLLDSVRWLP